MAIRKDDDSDDGNKDQYPAIKTTGSANSLINTPTMGLDLTMAKLTDLTGKVALVTGGGTGV